MLRRHKENLAAVNKTSAFPGMPTMPEEKTDSFVHYKKSDIARMAVADLKQLASELSIENFENMSGEKLKEAIIAKLGL